MNELNGVMAEEHAPFAAVNSDCIEETVHGLVSGAFGIFTKQSLSASGLRSVFYVTHVPSAHVMGAVDSLGGARRARDMAAKLMPDCLLDYEPLIASDVIRRAWLQFGFEELDEIDDEGNVILQWTGNKKWLD